MKLICPKCGSGFELEQAVRELEQSETHDIAAKLGQYWRLVYEYSDCFRQSEFGNVSMSKRLRIFKDIARLLDALIFSYRGKRYRTSWHETIKAITNTCNAQKWGFTKHNYLLSILVKTADRLSVEGLTAAEEQKREEERKYRATPVESADAVPDKSGNSTGQGQLDFKKLATDVRR